MHYANIFERNAQWAKQKAKEDLEYFKHLSGLHVPELLWIGCADCRMPGREIRVHGLVYGLQDGLLHDLHCGTADA